MTTLHKKKKFEVLQSLECLVSFNLLFKETLVQRYGFFDMWKFVTALENLEISKKKKLTSFAIVFPCFSKKVLEIRF